MDLQRSGAVSSLWPSLTIPAGGAAIVTQTAPGNLNTSDYPIVPCVGTIPAGDTRIPKITIRIGGADSSFLDTAHVLDIGGFDLSCRGNESLGWRRLGTVRMSIPGEKLVLSPSTSTGAGGTPLAVSARLTDASDQPLANASIAFRVLSGPNAGRTGQAYTDTQGYARLTYTGDAQGVDVVRASLTNASGAVVASNEVTVTWTSLACTSTPPPGGSGSTTLVYLGATAGQYGDPANLAALLTDANGSALAGRPVTFLLGSQSLPATTDATGVARTSFTPTAVRPVSVTVSFAGDASNVPATTSATLNIEPEDVLLRYTGKTLLDTAVPQTLTASFNGKTTGYSHDVLNRLTGKTPDPSLGEPGVLFSYTPTGQRATMTDASGATSYTYDNRDRLKTKVTPQGTLNYTYDATSNVLSIQSSNSNGASMSYAYDVLNRLATVTDPSGPTTYTYTTAGQMATVRYPTTVRWTYSYDSLDRVLAMPAVKTATLANYTYTMGPAGNRLSMTELNGRKANYAYDSIFKLTGETITTDPAANNGTIGYTHDPVGNRLSLTSSVPAVPAAIYAYDANDRLAADTYDANGNTITSGGNILAYDFENRLKSRNGGAVTMVYDGDGNRVSKTVGGVTTKYLVDDRNPTGLPQVVDEVVNGAVQRVYSYGLARTTQRQLLSGVWTTHFYGYDAHGTVRYLTNTAGTLSDSYTYDAFGNVIATVGSTPNFYLYAGEQFDPDLGLYYLRARYYSPRVGRFLTQDPFFGIPHDPLTIHKYLYGNADPVNKLDRTGRIAITEQALVTGFLATATAIAFAQSRRPFPFVPTVPRAPSAPFTPGDPCAAAYFIYTLTFCEPMPSALGKAVCYETADLLYLFCRMMLSAPLN